MVSYSYNTGGYLPPTFLCGLIWRKNFSSLKHLICKPMESASHMVLIQIRLGFQNSIRLGRCHAFAKSHLIWWEGGLHWHLSWTLNWQGLCLASISQISSTCAASVVRFCFESTCSALLRNSDKTSYANGTFCDQFPLKSVTVFVCVPEFMGIKLLFFFFFHQCIQFCLSFSSNWWQVQVCFWPYFCINHKRKLYKTMERPAKAYPLFHFKGS